jgi:hypothetical protein
MTWSWGRQRAAVPKASAERTSGANRQPQSGRSNVFTRYLVCSNHLKTRSVRGCYLCSRYVLSPMSPGRTEKNWSRERELNPRPVDCSGKTYVDDSAGSFLHLASPCCSQVFGVNPTRPKHVAIGRVFSGPRRSSPPVAGHQSVSSKRTWSSKRRRFSG